MDNDKLLALGALLRRRRERRGWTQEQLAERAGARFSVETISKIERGRNRPRQHTLEKVMDALELDDSERKEILSSWRACADPHPAKGVPATLESVEWPAGRFLGTKPVDVMVARSDELSRALTALDAASSGSGRLVLLAGAAGIGKTRLAQDIAVRAWKGTFLVAVGRCYETQSAVPFSPFREALGDLLDRARSGDRKDAVRRWTYLAKLLPDQGESQITAGNSSPEEQQQLFHEVTDFIRSIAQVQPVAILLDDLHWADSASLDLVLHLVSHTRRDRVFVLGTHRDVSLQRRNSLQATLGDLISGQLVDRVRLHPLRREDTAVLAETIVGKRLPDSLNDLIHARTEGNPFFIQQVIHALQDRATAEGIPLDGLGDVGEVPESVRLMIQRRMDRLSNNSQGVLIEASVLGQSFGFSELQSMCDRAVEALEGALDEAIGMGLLREAGDDAYEFDHALTQESIYAQLSSRRKQRLHRAAGEALARLPERRHEGRAAEITWHFMRGNDPERALPWTLRAGEDAAAVFAHSDAVAQYRKAAELAHDLENASAEAEALTKLGDVLYRSGQYREAVDPLEHAREYYERVGERESFLRTAARSAEAFHFAGRVAEGIDRLSPIVQALEDNGPEVPPSSGMADVYGAMCALYLGAGRWRDALQAGERAVSLAEATGNLRALCTSEISRGIALGIANRIPEQGRAFEHASEIAEPMGDPWLLSLAVYHHGVSCLSSDDFERGEQHMRRALEVAEGASLLGWATFAHASLSDLLVTRGRWEDARMEAERAVAESRKLGPRVGSSYPLIALGRIQLLLGERDQGLQCLEEALALSARFEYPPGMAGAHETLAWQDVREGRPEDAVARLEPMLAASRAASHPRLATVFVWALLETGDDKRAEEVLAGARQHAMASTSRAALPEVLRQSAKIATSQEHWADAVRDLWEGMAIARELGLTYDEALLHEEYGRMHMAKSERDQAHMRLDEALEIFQTLGASLEVERVAQALDTLTFPVNVSLAPVTATRRNERRRGERRAAYVESENKKQGDAG